MKKTWIALFMIILLMSISCSDTTSSTDKKNPPEAATEIYIPTISISDAHTDSYATYVYTSVEIVSIYQVILAGFFEQGNIPWENKGDHWEYSETEDDLTIILKVYETTTQYEIDWVLDGTDGDYIYDNLTVFKMTQSKSGKSGSSTTYDLNSSSTLYELSTYTWALDDNNLYTAVLIVYEEDGTPLGEIDYTINPDGSGEYYAYTYGTISEHAQWNSDGSGSLTDYSTNPPTVHEWGPNPTAKTDNHLRDFGAPNLLDTWKSLSKTR